HLVEGRRLGEGARVAVHDEAAGPIRTVKALGDQGIDEFIRHQLPRLDERLDPEASGRSLADRIAEEVAGGDVLQSIAAGQQVRLRALAAARRTKKDEAHNRPVYQGKPPWTPCLRDNTSSTIILGNFTHPRKGNLPWDAISPRLAARPGG